MEVTTSLCAQNTFPASSVIMEFQLAMTSPLRLEFIVSNGGGAGAVGVYISPNGPGIDGALYELGNYN